MAKPKNKSQTKKPHGNKGNKFAVGHGRPRKFQDVNELIKLITKYINDRLKNQEKVTYTGLLYALGTTKDVMDDYCKGKYNEGK